MKQISLPGATPRGKDSTSPKNMPVGDPLPPSQQHRLFQLIQNPGMSSFISFPSVHHHQCLWCFAVRNGRSQIPIEQVPPVWTAGARRVEADERCKGQQKHHHLPCPFPAEHEAVGAAIPSGLYMPNNQWAVALSKLLVSGFLFLLVEAQTSFSVKTGNFCSQPVGSSLYSWHCLSKKAGSEGGKWLLSCRGL